MYTYLSQGKQYYFPEESMLGAIKKALVDTYFRLYPEKSGMINMIWRY